MKGKIKVVAVFLVVTALAVMSRFIFFNKESDVLAKVVFTSETCVAIQVLETDGEANLIDALQALENTGALSYESKDSQFGAYILSVNGKSEISGYSWMVYTSDRTEGVANTEVEPLVVDGINYYSMLVGVSSISVKAGEYYLLNFEGWSYP